MDRSVCATSNISSVADVSNFEHLTDQDADLKEIEKMLPSSRRILTDDEKRHKHACRQLLMHHCAVISTLSLTKAIAMDAANFLVEECLFLFTEDLFEPHSQLEPEGYIKYIPDNPDLLFIDRLLNYGIDPTLYLQNINIPIQNIQQPSSALPRPYVLNQPISVRILDKNSKLYLFNTRRKENSINMSDENGNENNNLLTVAHGIRDGSIEVHHGSSSDSSRAASASVSPNTNQLGLIAKELKDLNQGILKLNKKIDTILLLNQLIVSTLASDSNFN